MARWQALGGTAIASYIDEEKDVTNGTLFSFKNEPVLVQKNEWKRAPVEWKKDRQENVRRKILGSDPILARIGL